MDERASWLATSALPAPLIPNDRKFSFPFARGSQPAQTRVRVILHCSPLLCLLYYGAHYNIYHVLFPTRRRREAGDIGRDGVARGPSGGWCLGALWWRRHPVIPRGLVMPRARRIDKGLPGPTRSSWALGAGGWYDYINLPPRAPSAYGRWARRAGAFFSSRASCGALAGGSVRALYIILPLYST